MAKKKKSAKIEYLRNPYALHASRRRAAIFKDRRKERGGATNTQRNYREEANGS